LKCRYTSPCLDYSGYGEAARNDIGSLNSVGMQLTLEIPRYVSDISDFGKLGGLIAEMENRELAYKIKIIHSTPDQFKHYAEADKYNIGRLVWETTKLPDEFAEGAKSVDEIWTTSNECKRVIENQGIKTPVYVIPEAIDTSLDLDTLQPFKTQISEGFVFYSIFEWIERKNPEALLKAYWSEFKEKDDVALLLKTYRYNFTPDKKREIKSYINRIKNELKLSYYAPVYVYLDLLDKQQIYRLHKTGDCFVSSHRGEGWGIPQMEAMLVGNTMISTGYNGIHEYIEHKKTGLLADYELKPIRQYAQLNKWYQPGQMWAEVNPIHLQELMRYAYRYKKNKIGKNARNLILDKFSYAAVGAIMKKRLEEIDLMLAQKENK
jgi:glycosyltransferase involved in cell wall biosynthesis